MIRNTQQARQIDAAPLERSRRRGIALLEVLVSLTILSVSLLSATRWVLDAANARASAEAEELRFARAADFLDHVALWPTSDLDRNLGDRPQGPFRLRIERVEPMLYAVALAESIRPAKVLIETTLYRPMPTEATLQSWASGR